MLGKLMKYDLKSMFKSFTPLWLALLAVSAVNRFLVFRNDARFANGVSAFVSIFLYGSLCIAVVVVTIVLIIRRFYSGLLKDEGYLMFTLPVKTWQLVASKCLSATIITLLSMIAGLLSVFILVPGIQWHQLFEAISKYARFITGDMVLSGVLLLLLVLFTVIKSVTYIYTSLALGHLASKHRVGWSVAAFIGINVVLTTLGTNLVTLFSKEFPNVRWDFFPNSVSDIPATNGCLLALIGITLVQVVIFFFATERILAKHLNLE